MRAPQFDEQMRTLLGEVEWQRMQAALDEPPVVSVRVNKVRKCESSMFNGQKPVPWCSSGYYLDERPDFTLDPCFHAGGYYVQEASSMFVEQALKQCGEPKIVLDLCAAPGGKSTLLRSLLPDDALLVCNEPIKARANVLRENIIKWGHEGCFVSCNYPRDFRKLRDMFDVVVVDAPCSGEGMFRKEQAAIDMWSAANVEECAIRQRDIVETIWPALKSGGYLIYSTCTYNTRENEENVQHFCDTLGAELVEIPVAEDWHITGSLLSNFNGPVYRFMPHKTRGEGFFLALMRKNMGARVVSTKVREANMQHFEIGNTVYAVDAAHAPVVRQLTKVLYPLYMGVALYEKKGNKQIPHHALAMSRMHAKDAYPTVALGLDDALRYLRHEALRIDAPRGYVLVSYDGLPLGFVNNVGNHANNLYPAEWRIRKR
ncbi:MAG: rRNA cytosine-C5-methyltransferase [Bacteroidaceae bacterium]|nr:rRNA cytosine-C5-methyltransferase [Bacteroidaceae bacterium]